MNSDSAKYVSRDMTENFGQSEKMIARLTRCARKKYRDDEGGEIEKCFKLHDWKSFYDKFDNIVYRDICIIFILNNY